MSNQNPKISVLMPAYNIEAHISDAIKSILNQTFTDFEFIIIDDGSSDNTWQIILENAKKDSRIFPLRNSVNSKLSRTLNKGLEIASGKYIARMDADDISIRNRLQKQYDFMEKNPAIGIIGGTMEVRTIKNRIVGKRRYNLTDALIRKRIYRYCPFCHPVVMIRKSILDQVGGYNERWNPAEDYELYFRIGKCSKFANLPDLLLIYRILPESMTRDSTRKMWDQTFEIRKKFSSDLFYPMNSFDRIYNFLQYAAGNILPVRWQHWLFHIIRDSK